MESQTLSFLMEKRKEFSELLPRAPFPNRIKLILGHYDTEIQKLLKREGKQRDLTEVGNGC